jgi:transposase
LVETERATVKNMKTKKPKAKKKSVTQEGNAQARKKSQEQAAAERRVEAHRLRLKGFSLRFIGKSLGVTAKTICLDLQKFRKELNAESAGLAAELKEQEDAKRLLEDERLDEQLLLIHGMIHPDPKKVETGERQWLKPRELIRAIESLRKNGESRRRLWGLDGSVKIEDVSPDGSFRERVLSAIGAGEAAAQLLAEALGEEDGEP